MNQLQLVAASIKKLAICNWNCFENLLSKIIWSPSSMIIPLQQPKGNPPGYPVYVSPHDKLPADGGDERHKLADAWAE